MLHHVPSCRTAFFWDNKFHLQHNVSTMIFPASRPVAEMRVGRLCPKCGPMAAATIYIHTYSLCTETSSPITISVWEAYLSTGYIPSGFCKTRTRTHTHPHLSNPHLWMWVRVLMGMRAGCHGKPQGSP